MIDLDARPQEDPAPDPLAEDVRIVGRNVMVSGAIIAAVGLCTWGSPPSALVLALGGLALVAGAALRVWAWRADRRMQRGLR